MERKEIYEGHKPLHSRREAVWLLRVRVNCCYRHIQDLFEQYQTSVLDIVDRQILH